MKIIKVITRFFDDGRVTVEKQVFQNLTEKPENFSNEYPEYDIYCDFFESEKEANEFIASVAKA